MNGYCLLRTTIQLTPFVPDTGNVVVLVQQHYPSLKAIARPLRPPSKTAAYGRAFVPAADDNSFYREHTAEHRVCNSTCLPTLPMFRRQRNQGHECTYLTTSIEKKKFSG